MNLLTPKNWNGGRYKVVELSDGEFDRRRLEGRDKVAEITEEQLIEIRENEEFGKMLAECSDIEINAALSDADNLSVIERRVLAKKTRCSLGSVTNPYYSADGQRHDWRMELLTFLDFDGNTVGWLSRCRFVWATGGKKALGVR